MTLIELRARTLDIAVGELGVRETAPNRGPRVERYQREVGIQPGDPWCMAFVAFCFAEAARTLGGESPLPRTGKVARFWRKCNQLWLSGFPSVGAIYCHLTDPRAPESPGHCGIVLRLTDDGSFFGVEGNSNPTGSREGDGVVMNRRHPRYVNLGFVDVAREGPKLEPLIA